MKPPGAIRSLLRGLGRRDGTDTPPTPHTFREKAFRRGGACAACREPLGPQGLVCRVCKVTSHEHCQAKVPGPCQAAPPPERAGPGRGKPRQAAPPSPRPLQRRNTAPVGSGEHMGSSWSLNGTRQCSTLPRAPPEPELSLSHVTERILCLRFPRRLPPGRHRWHLRGLARALAGRHRDRYTIFNLSEPRGDLARLNPRVQEFGWPDGHAPPLERLCAVCRALEGWLGAHPHNVAVLHCRGCKGKAGVVVAAYMHYSQASASADQALAALTMRKFCEEKLGAELQPSQRRYVAHFAALLSGRVRMNSSPRFLHHVLLPPLPGCQPFLKIYQALQLVYTSGVYSAPGPQGLCISLEPALLLKGDVMVKCYRWLGGARRRALFRAQFHTGALLSARLRLRWAELDEPCTDERCPPDARVELLFSSGPASTGCPSTRCPPAVPVRLAGGEPALRWDSYEGLGLRHEDSAEELPQAPAREQRVPGPGNALPPTPAERRELERLLGGCGLGGGAGPAETPSPQGDTPHGTPGPHGTPAPYGTLTPHCTPEPRGSPEPHGAPTPCGSPTPCGTPAPYGTPEPHGAPVPCSPQPSGTVTPYGSPAPHSPEHYGSPDPYGTPEPPSTRTPHGTPAPYGTPEPHSPEPRETPAPYRTLTPYGTPELHGPEPYGTPTSCGTPTPHGATAPYGTPVPHSAPAPLPCGGASLPPACSCCFVPPGLAPPERPRCGTEGARGAPGGGVKQGVQRSLSEGPPPCGSGHQLWGYQLWEGLRPLEGPSLLCGVHSERGGENEGEPPHLLASGPAPESPACPHCGHPGLGLGRAPPRAPLAPQDPYGRVGYRPREGYGSPAQPDQQEPTERRSPGEGGSWPKTPEGPSSSPRCPAPPPASSGPQGRGPGTPPPCSHPLLPEKRRPPAPGGPRDGAAPEAGSARAVTFAQDASRFWYKPGLSRDRAVALLKGEPPGSFLVRESRSCPGAFGLALRVPAPPSGTRSLPHGTGDPREQLVRHFLIESGPRGVRVRGCREEPQFGSLPALVLHHSVSPISLPCALRLPSKDPLEETGGQPASPSVSTAAELLRQGAACSVLLLGSVDTEALTGPQALAKAAGTILGGSPAPRPCLVHFRVSAQGITLTDSQRRLFFRRHYPVSSVTYCNTDPEQRRWANEDGTTSTIFGFVAKKAGGAVGGNTCHVFAEHDPEQPATAIVTFVTRVMLGTRRA